MLHVLDDPMTVTELADDLGMDGVAVRDRIAYLEKHDRVIRDGEKVRPAK